MPIVPSNDAVHWTQGKRDAAIARSCHKSALEHIDSLREEFTDMIKRKQWVLFPGDLIKHKSGLQLSPIDVVPQQDWHPCTILDYSYFGINDDTAKLALESSV